MAIIFNYKFYELIFFRSNDNLDDNYKICQAYFGGVTLPAVETLFGQEVRDITVVDDIIERIKEVINGKRECYEIVYEYSLAAFDVYQYKTKLIDMGLFNEETGDAFWEDRVSEEYQYVDTQTILKLYLDWRKFLIDREDMVYVRKQKVVKD